MPVSVLRSRAKGIVSQSIFHFRRSAGLRPFPFRLIAPEPEDAMPRLSQQPPQSAFPLSISTAKEASTIFSISS